MIEDWLESHIDDTIKITGNGEEAHFNCPICGEHRHRMYVNLHTGKVYCHNCGYFSSQLVSFISEIEGVSYSQATTIFQDISGHRLLPNLSSGKNLRQQVLLTYYGGVGVVKRPIPLPEEYIPIDIQNPSIIMKQAIRYLKSRKITKQQIESHDMGICVEGEYKGRIIIPIKEDNEYKFWVARAMSDSAYRKEKSPSNTPYQISKSEVLFNIDRAAKEWNSCVLSEGIYDALSWGTIGVSMLGKVLYQSQLEILLGYRKLLTEGVYIALDWDAKDNATKIAEQLHGYFPVRIIDIPQEYDDPNKFYRTHKRSDMMELINSAQLYTPLSKVYRLLS